MLLFDLKYNFRSREFPQTTMKQSLTRFYFYTALSVFLTSSFLLSQTKLFVKQEAVIINEKSNLDDSSDNIGFNDKIMGFYSQRLLQEVGDFVLQRRDGLISYQLAVVVDDYEQGITEVVRGTDLLDSTPRQILLQKCLKYNSPDYIHIPLAVNSTGQKLSKQNFAKSLVEGCENETLWIALKWLQQNPPRQLRQENVEKILDWGIAHWDLSKLPKSVQSIVTPNDLKTIE